VARQEQQKQQQQQEQQRQVVLTLPDAAGRVLGNDNVNTLFYKAGHGSVH
jgi:hypothetical protein